MKEKIILYGISDAIPFLEVYYSMLPCFNIIGISDKNETKGIRRAVDLSTKYINPNNIESYEYKYIFVTTPEAIFPEIYRELVHQLNIQWDKVVYYREFYKELHLSLGDLNPNTTIYVLRVHPANGGIVTQTVSFLTQLIDLPRDYQVFVDLKNYTNVYVFGDQLGKINAWDYWFDQPSSITEEEVYNSKNVVLCGCANYYLAERPFWAEQKYRDLYHLCFDKYIHLNQRMRVIVEEEIERIDIDFLNTCAVIYRGTDYTLLKTYGHSIQPSIEEVIEKVHELKNKWGFNKVYFSTEDAIAHKAFLEEFGDLTVCSDRKLVEKYPLKESKSFGVFDHSALTNVVFDRRDDSFLKGMEYLRQIIIASKCRYIISGNHGGYWGTLIMSPNGFEKKYIFDLGTYGIDDDSYATAWGHYVLINEERKIEEQRKRQYGDGE